MATAAYTPSPCVARPGPLAIRRRRDLRVSLQQAQGQNCWVVKDPLSAQYFRFDDDEFALLQLLEGELSFPELEIRFREERPAANWRRSEIEEFISVLVGHGLAVADQPGQGKRLYERGRKRGRSERLSKLANLFWIRLPGVDPDRLLTKLDRYLGWIFSATFAWLAMAFLAVTGLFVAVHAAEFWAEAPTIAEFFAAENLVWLALVIFVTKVVHEFGHGLACKHLGGEVHEMGFVLLMFMPCMYCDVTDSWMLPNKWQRMLIGAAGMFAELLMAALAAWIWWASEPGLVKFLAIQVMLVCSVTTLAFNANPFLRYDGYYILSDWIEIPNLRAKSTEACEAFLLKWCLGRETTSTHDRPLATQAGFAAYAVVASVYRWVLLFGVLWFLEKALEPYRLEIIGRMLSVLLVGGLVVQPWIKLGRWLRKREERQPVNYLRMTATIAVLVAIVSALAWYPLPQHVYTTCMVEMTGARRVYVYTPGVLVQVCVQPGDVVEAGQELATLADPAVLQSLAELEAQRDAQKRVVENLHHERFQDPLLAERIPTAEQALADLEASVAERRLDAERLVIRAPQAGTIIAPPGSHAKPPRGDLPSWSATPLDPRNLGCHLDAGTLVCQIGDPLELECIVAIEQSEIEFIRADQPIEILLDGFPHFVLTGRLSEIAKVEIDETPEAWSAKSGGRLATRTEAHGAEQPLFAHYRARAPLDSVHPGMRPGMRGRAKIRVGSQTWLAWAARVAEQTFQFRW